MKKLISLGIAATLAFGAFALVGCDGQGDTTPTTPQTPVQPVTPDPPKQPNNNLARQKPNTMPLSRRSRTPRVLP